MRNVHMIEVEKKGERALEYLKKELS